MFSNTATWKSVDIIGKTDAEGGIPSVPPGAAMHAKRKATFGGGLSNVDLIDRLVIHVTHATPYRPGARSKCHRTTVPANRIFAHGPAARPIEEFAAEGYTHIDCA